MKPSEIIRNNTDDRTQKLLLDLWNEHNPGTPMSEEFVSHMAASPDGGIISISGWVGSIVEWLDEEQARRDAFEADVLRQLENLK